MMKLTLSIILVCGSVSAGEHKPKPRSYASSRPLLTCLDALGDRTDAFLHHQRNAWRAAIGLPAIRPGQGGRMGKQLGGPERRQRIVETSDPVGVDQVQP